MPPTPLVSTSIPAVSCWWLNQRKAVAEDFVPLKGQQKFNPWAKLPVIRSTVQPWNIAQEETALQVSQLS